MNDFKELNIEQEKRNEINVKLCCDKIRHNITIIGD